MTPAHRSSVDEHDSTPGEEEGEVCVKWEGEGVYGGVGGGGVYGGVGGRKGGVVE